ncbi:LysE family translocator [Sulfitobacter sp. F26204]|uniref:LysE family translocator n=1 Tax=Sulfitobacter sp. F26204 TaxID=2996014 RepID=UPI00225DDC43|nr:LysE family translocator [Sulfitobacter sp. F26204]MCX7558527.1 LysE family translocator [Sulfitobacter sp. F26204]
MNIEILPALALFAFVSSATPGPNNLMLMASGANYGFRRTVPHMLGISVGFAVMMLLTGMGLAQVFERFPISYTLLKFASVTYMLYLAWKIANAAPIRTRSIDSRPMTFLQAASFQWVNPKAWAMALTAITVYVADNGAWMLLIGALCFAMVNLPSVSFWTVMGQQMARFLTNPGRLRLFNWTMAALLIASLYPLLQMG